jgi:hypothetical protein
MVKEQNKFIVPFQLEDRTDDDDETIQDTDSVTDSTETISSCPTTPESSYGHIILSRAAVRRLVEAILQSNYFNSLLDSFILRVKTSTAPNNNDRATAGNFSGGNNSGSTAPGPSDKPSWKSQRRPGPGHNSDSDDGGGGGDDPDEPAGGVGSRPERRLACPYFKHSPDCFRDIGSCGGRGWQTTHRLK